MSWSRALASFERHRAQAAPALAPLVAILVDAG
jgi:hypothetical protein